MADLNDNVEQITHYYPFGMAFAESQGSELQPYKYNNKELDKELGLEIYDYVARQMDQQLGRFMSIDPLAEKYYSWSPYAYVMNNPMKYADPTGMDTVPSNEIWEFYLINYRSDGVGKHKTDRYIPVMVDGKEKYRLYSIESGENEEGYEEYSYDYVVGADKVNDFKSGKTEGSGYFRGIIKLAVDGGMDGKAGFLENAGKHLKNQWNNPINILFDIAGSNPYAPGDWISPPNGWLFSGKNINKVLKTHNPGNYKNTQYKGTKNNPLKNSEIKQRLNKRK